jgi:lipopolysaccharide transport system ATP-binding protein
MIKSVVTCSNLYKAYRIPQKKLGFFSIFHRDIFHNNTVLEDINLDIKQGSIFGILGRNGSGKSTLLKLITGILQPTFGNISVEGKVSAILELGAGFNPYMSGRDNAQFLGKLNGLSGSEIPQWISEVENFADIGTHFDHEVKIYSSGMFVRLAFAVAICNNPDILVVDEALAVGDISFQEKCINKIKDFRRQGKTIIFVSHSTEVISNLCDYAILIENKKISCSGSPSYVVDRYLQSIYTMTIDKNRNLAPDKVIYSMKAEERIGYNRNEVIINNGGAEIIDCYISMSGNNINLISSGDSVELIIGVKFYDLIDSIIGFEIKTHQGISLYGITSWALKKHIAGDSKIGINYYKFKFIAPLNCGDYFIDCGVAKNNNTLSGEVLCVRRSVITFTVITELPEKYSGLVNLKATFQELDI